MRVLGFNATHNFSGPKTTTCSAANNSDVSLQEKGAAPDDMLGAIESQDAWARLGVCARVYVCARVFMCAYGVHVLCVHVAYVHNFHHCSFGLLVQK